MKKIIAIIIIALSFSARSQSISPVSGNTDVVIGQNGSITIGGVLRGSIVNNVIKNAQDVVIGSITDDGTIKNANNVLVGTFNDMYEVKNSSNVVIGYMTSTLDVMNSAQVNLGKFPEQSPMIWSAVAYFFFDLN